MQALLLTKYGEPPLVTLGDVADPAPEAGQVLIRVHAAGLNPIDAKLARGWMASVMSFELPVALGWDFAGVVEAAGPDVEGFTVGQEVFGSLGPPTGSTAELVVADARGPWLAPKPETLSMADAAAVPMVGLTALTIERALARRDGTVLIIGAGGAIGAFLVPLLTQAGVTVVATASGASVARLQEAGAQVVIDFRAEDVHALTREHTPEGVDAVIDLVNQFDALNASAALLRRGGRLLSTLFGPEPSEMARDDIELTYIRNSPLEGDLARVAALVASGAVTPLPHRTIAFADARDAFGRLLAGSAGAKLVLDLAAPVATSSPTALTTGAPR